MSQVLGTESVPIYWFPNIRPSAALPYGGGGCPPLTSKSVSKSGPVFRIRKHEIYTPADEKLVRFLVSKRDRFPYQNMVLIALIFLLFSYSDINSRRPLSKHSRIVCQAARGHAHVRN